MRKLDFFKLPRPTQERFLESAQGASPPAPIVQRLGDPRAQVFIGLAGGAGFLFLLLLLLGFGSLESGLAKHGAPLLLLYFGLIFAVPFGVLRFVRPRVLAKKLPWKPGVYVFPMCLVDARSASLAIHSMKDLSKMDKASASSPLRLSFKGGGTYEFPVAGGADDANFRFDVAQKQAEHALASGDDGELTTLDPFHESRKSWTSPIGPTSSLVDRTPGWLKNDLFLALAVAVLLAPVSWALRNALSDRSMYAKAAAVATPEAWRSYLVHGTTHADEVQTTLLPRAELEVAKKAQTVESIRAFQASHPGSAVDAEANAALHDAFLRELDKAKAKGSLAALDEFTKTYPDHHLDKEIAAAKHDLYAKSAAAFTKLGKADDPAVKAFVDKLRGWLEAHGTTVTIVFRREVSPALAQADKLIGAAPLNKNLGAHQVTQWFDPNADQPKEGDVAKAFQVALQKLFAPDLAFVTMGPDGDEAATQALAAKTPLVVVRYRFGWLGAAYSSAQLKRSFAGVYVSGEATFSVPGDASPLKVRLEVPPPKAFLPEYKSVHPGLSSAGPPNPDAPEKDVYAAMDLRVLDLIAGTLEGTLLKPVP